MVKAVFSRQFQYIKRSWVWLGLLVSLFQNYRFSGKLLKMSQKIAPAKFSLKLSRSILVLFAILMLVFGLLLLSYSNFYPPLLDKKYIFALDNLVASIPALPKTPKQIVTKSFYSNKKLNGYSAGGSVSLKGSGSNEISLSFVGKVNKAGLFGSSSLTDVKGKVVGQLNGAVDFQTIAKDDNFYFRTVGNLGLVDFDPTLLGKDWYQLDLDKFQTSLGVQAKKDSEIISDVAISANKLQKDSVERNLFSKLIESKELKIDKEVYYQFKFSMDERLLNDLGILSGYEIDKPILKLLINKKSFFLELLEINSQVTPTGNDSLKEKLQLRLEYQIFNINKEQKIETPQKSKTIVNPVEFSLAFEGKANGSDEELLEATSKAIDRGQNFLTIERLLRVILLLPKAIYSN